MFARCERGKKLERCDLDSGGGGRDGVNQGVEYVLFSIVLSDCYLEHFGRAKDGVSEVYFRGV